MRVQSRIFIVTMRGTMTADEAVVSNAFQTGYWVFSPPQESTIGVMKDSEKLSDLVKWVQLVMIDAGFLGGVMVFHPWRLQNGIRVLSPHFHFVGYGDVDNCLIADRYNCAVK